MALNLGLESLQGKVQQAEEKPVELSDLLASQIEFHEAYQAFIDYKNVCEIVVKAKSSTESIEFANNLLNASVENIEVSVEGLGEKFVAAWKKFVVMWENFMNWVKRAFNLFWNSITKKKDGTFTIKPNIGKAEMEEMCSWIQELLANSAALGSTKTSTAASGLNHAANRSGSDVLKTGAEVKAWCKVAKTTIEKMDHAVKQAKKNYDSTKFVYGMGVKTFGDARDQMAAAKTIMRIAPRLFRGIQTTIEQVNAEYKEVKSH